MYMTFFFQRIPIGVILKIVLAPPSLTMGVSGCFLSTVQKTWNKVCASIIKRASHGSGGWIKASCSESMHFCKINIHISNVINCFFSLPLTVIRGSHPGGSRVRASAICRIAFLWKKKNVRASRHLLDEKLGFGGTWLPWRNVRSWLHDGRVG